jgi:hypothetical protein
LHADQREQVPFESLLVLSALYGFDGAEK